MNNKAQDRRRFVTEARDVILLVALGIGMAWLGFGCANCDTDTRLFVVVSLFSALSWILLWKGNEYISGFLDSYVSWLHQPLKRLVVGLLATIIYSPLVMLLLEVVFDRFFAVNLSTSAVISIVITLVISVFMHGRGFLLNWRAAAIEAEKLKSEMLQARYDTLRNQVSPHFLFNSLNTLSNLVYEDEERAELFIDQLADIFRYVVEKQTTDIVPLNDELQFLHSYLGLQQIRFGSKLQYRINVDGSDGVIPPLTLQMLAENAIKHNVISQDHPLSIEFFGEGDFLVVRNNLQERLSFRDTGHGLGLENISRRYAALTDHPVTAGAEGVMFVVRLPCLWAAGVSLSRTDSSPAETS